MALGTNLAKLLVMLRREAGQTGSIAAGINVDDNNRGLLARVQDTLWLDRDWVHLRVDRDVELQAGSRFYTIPSDLPFDRVELVETQWQDQWVPVAHGISSAEYNAMNPELNVRNDPVQNWMYRESGQVEVWPLPATNDVRIRFTGTRALRPLVEDVDIADLDDQLIVLFAAAELLAGQKSPRARAVIDSANRRLLRLSGNAGSLQRHRMTDGGRTPDARSELWRMRVTYARAL